MEDPQFWNDPSITQVINQEKSVLEKEINEWELLNARVDDALVLLEMCVDEKDEETFEDLKKDVQKIVLQFEDLEVCRLLGGELDKNNTFLSIHSGAGGTEACDWAEMLMRMYLRYAERQGHICEIIAMTEGDGAGIKSVTLSIQGLYAYGYLKAENGVHRLVRISPFDSNARRHTSFSSVFAWAEVSDDIEVEIKSEDIRVDTYRASGAGGQHVNKTDSAVRLTHAPTGIVVQCQSERSQHSNRDRAMKMLKAALYEKELEQRQEKLNEAHASKKSNEWGSQIRSYVLHPYQMVKDHRTGVETSQVKSVLDGEIDLFVKEFLKLK